MKIRSPNQSVRSMVFKEHDRMVAIPATRPDKKGLRDLAGTLTHDEASAMQELIVSEFETIEGSW